MNSSENHPFEQLLEYSGSAIKRDLRGSSKRSVEAQLIAQMADDYHGAGALGLVNHSIERLVCRDVALEFAQEPTPAAAGIAWYEGALTNEGLKDKIVVVASESVRSPWMIMGIEQALAANGRTHDDLILVTPGQYMEYVGVRVPSEMLAVIDEMGPITRQFACEANRLVYPRRGKGKRSAFNRAERWK